MTRGIGWPDPVPMRTRNCERAYCIVCSNTQCWELTEISDQESFMSIGQHDYTCNICGEMAKVI